MLSEPDSVPTPVFSGQNREESEAYSRVLAVVNPRLRVIHGKCGLQWIMQVRKSPSRWESIAFCGTKEGLLLRLKEHWRETCDRKERELMPLERLAALRCDPAAWAIIEALPDYYPK